MPANAERNDFGAGSDPARNEQHARDHDGRYRSDTANPSGSPTPGGTPGVAAVVDELRFQFGRYLSAEADRLRLKVRRAVLFAIAGICAAAMAVTALVTAVVLVFAGLSGLVARLLGVAQWAGALIVGASTLAFAAIGVYAATRYLKRFFLAQTRAKYEHLRTRQRDLRR